MELGSARFNKNGVLWLFTMVREVGMIEINERNICIKTGVFAVKEEIELMGGISVAVLKCRLIDVSVERNILITALQMNGFQTNESDSGDDLITL